MQTERKIIVCVWAIKWWYVEDVSVLSTIHDKSTTEVPGSREAHGKQKHCSVWGYKLDQIITY